MNVVTRRNFLAGSGAVIAAGAVGPRLAFASPEAPGTGDVIVLVFLRGGADGLSLVAPHQMPTYRALRPTVRVKSPSEVANPANAGLPLVSGGAVGAFPLSGVFAMHPGLAALHAGPWTDGHLAVVHAVGMPASESATRSHFDAMRNWEVGTAAVNLSTGFMNRFLLAAGATDRLAGVGRGSSLQRSLGGPVAAYSMGGISSFGVGGFSSNTKATAALTRWYDVGTGDIVSQTGATTLGAVGTVRAVNWKDPAYAVQNGAVYPGGSFGDSLREVAQLIRAGLGLRVACIDLDGWDTHGEMGLPEDPTGYFRGRCEELATGLAAFSRDLGTQMSEVTVATISEFGRSIEENGTGGVDHGRGSAMLVMGGGIRGGVHGPFVPTIVDGPEDDLTVLTDYRTVMAEVLSVRGGATDTSTLFPTWAPTAPLGLCAP
ncbi:MAG: DUF1501 domain-containing protein [Acidimicrobiales bacterium]